MTESQTRPFAFVRPPSASLADGLVTHIEKSEIDTNLAKKQWQGYVDALEKNGWPTKTIPPLDSAPDAVFIEDAFVMFGPNLAVITSPGAEPRKPETEGIEEILKTNGIEARRLEKGTLDGGDVLKIGNTVYVGQGGRTSKEGIESLQKVLPDHKVVAVPLTKVLHLKSAVTALPDGTVIGYEPLVDDVSVFEKFKAVPEEGGSHVVLLGPNSEGKQRVLMASSAPKSAQIFRDLGLDVITVDISEFEKLEGCVTCLSVRVR